MSLEPAPSPRRTGSWGWWLAAWVVLLPSLIPPLALVGQVLAGDSGSGLPAGRLLELFLSTFALTVAVTATALIIGTATAWLTSRTDIPGRRLWAILVALPLVIPSYVAALTIIGATGPAGLLSTWLGVGIPTPYGFIGAWLALSVFLAPMVHLILTPGLRLIDPSTEEAAVGLGASSLRTIFMVTLPQARPALIGAGLMVSLYTMSDFGAVSLLRFDTFTRAIYTLYVGRIDRGPAASLSLVLMIFAVAILVLERRTRTRARYHLNKPRRHRTPLVVEGWRKVGSLAFLTSYALVSLALPVSVLLFWLFRGVDAGQGVGQIWDEALRSLGVATVAACIAAVASFPVAMVTTRRRNRWSSLTESTVWAAYSLPHIAVGVAMVTFALYAARPIYQSLALLIATYVIIFLAQAMSSTQDSLRRSSPDLEDAARGLGKGPVGALAKVTVPLAMPGVLAGAALVFLSVMKELPATLLLRPNGFETLAVRIWSTTGEGFYTRAAVSSLALLAVSILPLLAVTRRDLGD